RATIQGYIYDPAGAVEAGYLDMAVAPEKVEASALTTAAQLGMLPAASYACNKNAIRKSTLDRIRASLGAHHQV
ncbi:MAG: enoyl-CoA hydratase, partial [Pseudomonadota bacterium]